MYLVYTKIELITITEPMEFFFNNSFV